MSSLIRSLCLFAWGLPVAVAVAASTPGPLNRFPVVSQDYVVFVARGELWRAPRSGGEATELVKGQGQVLFPHISQDGNSVAFTWRHGGLSDVYVVPIQGGEPRRLTHGPSYSPYDNAVTGWTTHGDILFVSQREAHLRGEYDTYRVAATGGLARPLGLGHSGTSSMAPDGGTITYDTSFRNFAGDRWKHYVGGQASELVSYNLASHAYARVTTWEGADTFPMWFRGQLFFLSDRGPEHRLNLWKRGTAANPWIQMTHYRDIDIDAPSVGPGGIAYQVNGEIYTIDTPDGAPRRIDLRLPETPSTTTVDVRDASHLTDVRGQSEFGFDARTHQAWFVARGDIYRVDATGHAENLTRTPGVSESYPSVSPDGREIAFVSDATGEDQVAVMPAGGGKPQAQSRFKGGVLYRPVWSPDGKGWVVADGDHNLWYVSRRSGATRLLAYDPFSEIRDATFSPDGTFVAYSRVRRYPDRAVHVVNVTTGEDRQLGPSHDSDHDPVFSPDGRDLFFLSERREQMAPSDRDELNIAGLASTGLYVASMREDDDAFPHQRPQPSSTIDWTRIFARAVPVSLSNAGALTHVTASSTHLFVHSEPVSTLAGQLGGMKDQLLSIGLRDGTSQVVAEDVSSPEGSSTGQGVAGVKNAALWVASDSGQDARKFDLGKAEPLTVPTGVEAAEVVRQAWLYDRGLFWDRHMNNVDWPAMLERYLPLARRTASPEDLTYVLGELQGELATSHMFISSGGDNDGRHDHPVALLGVDYALDISSGRYQLAHIYRGDASRPELRAPLGAPGIEVNDGDYLLAINGKSLSAPADPYELLPNEEKPVTLDVSASPSGPVRHVVVQPVFNETDIRRTDWIQRNAAHVANVSGGRYGYIFLRDFNANGAADLIRQWNDQAGREGMVIDLRANGGGSTSQWVLDLLSRRRAGGFVNRAGARTDLPAGGVPMKLVVITDPFSASDGDQFPYYFRKYGLGKVVGERTWGGVRGIQGKIPLLDGSAITVPKDSLFDADGAFILENKGAVPDIEVIYTPVDIWRGVDPQLDAAIHVLDVG
ncbi:S41 family peptidase [Dyella sp. C9]|uniref:S41 family peptidase n=1 Tax=Dyella sp. C9 TaxID=2202154 RepID=UPI0018E54158|nr:S41 family peptidase [Dyella sp. C9]